MMKRLSKGSRRNVGHVSDAKFASLFKEADVNVDDDDERQPRKTLKMLSNSKLVGNNQQLQKMFVCIKCQKAFQSSKALCGHMASHSVKEKALSKKKHLEISYSLSDTESGAKNSMRRSRRRNCKKFDDHVVDSSCKLDGNYSYSNSSSEASGVEHEQEEVAISLMMLSRDSSNWSGLNFIGDSSENNSMVFEARSVSTKTMMNSGCKKIETLDDLECGYVNNGANNVVTDLKFENLWKNQQDKRLKTEQNPSPREFKSTEKPKMGMYKRFEHKAVIHNQTHQSFIENVAADYKIFKAASTHRSGQNSLKTVIQHFPNNVGDLRKMRNTHECPICFKVFRSIQALGGHRRVHLAERSLDTLECDEVSGMFKVNVSQLHSFIDLNLPAPMEDEEAN